MLLLATEFPLTGIKTKSFPILSYCMVSGEGGGPNRLLKVCKSLRGGPWNKREVSESLAYVKLQAHAGVRAHVYAGARGCCVLPLLGKLTVHQCSLPYIDGPWR